MSIKYTYKTGLIVGRFQPFHLGHLSMIKQSLDKCEKLKIVIGSSNRNFEINNPLTVIERMKILDQVIKKEDWEDRIIQIKILEDVTDNLEWMDNLIEMAGEFGVVIGNDSLIAQLAKYNGYKVFYPKLTKREIWQATIIREKVLAKEKWQNLVPQYEIGLLEEFGLEERLKELAKSDK